MDYPDDLKAWLRAMPVSALPFNPGRDALYRVRDLYDGFHADAPQSWMQSYDHRNYEWFMQGKTPRSLMPAEAVAARLHDAGISMAIANYMAGADTKAVGFMGGHDVPRNDPVYRQIAQIARGLRAAGFVIVTGGGPGLMEAANLGAFMNGFPDASLDEPLATLCQVPDFSDATRDGWIATAVAAREKLLGRWDASEPQAGESLGIPTWLYGHEPPNLFASHSGKYFFNSVREDGLISISSGGIVFGPGNAGTVQEIFQDATLNYYRDPQQPPTPMVLYGNAFWNPDPASSLPRARPVMPVLETLGRDGNFANAIAVMDRPEDVIALIARGGCILPPRGSALRSPQFKGHAALIFPR